MMAMAPSTTSRVRFLNLGGSIFYTAKVVTRLIVHRSLCDFWRKAALFNLIPTSA
jgi:hypothetical protein